MRTTIRLDDHLLAEVKQLAAKTGRTLTSIIEDALRQMLAQRQQPGIRPKVHLPSFTGNGLLPGVDLDDSAALLDLMEQADGSSRR
ncbi:MAG: CopG family transcriptional regulator [Chloroflexi bacterium]|nr:CopG family transcriptional regulator [Chloroflexota bacterium]